MATDQLISTSAVPVGQFLERYRSTLTHVFRNNSYLDHLGAQRGLPPEMLQEILRCDPLQVFIPTQYGGLGGSVRDCLSLLEISSYESLPLSLMMGINGALFIQPVSRYAHENVAGEVLGRFAQEQAMGGLMITEPDYGSDALHMQTSFSKNESGYHVRGTKHWGGLTGMADYWLLTAREQKNNGSLGRDIEFFIHDNRNPGITVEHYFDNLGLYMLPYGRNKLDVQVPVSYKLEPTSTGIKLMLDMLHRSRLQFPGMAMGFLRRISDDALSHVRDRQVGGKALLAYDQVKNRLSRIQSWFTTCAAMCTFTSENASLSKDLWAEDVAANSIKSVVTDMMQDASQSFLQLVGAKGYTLEHLAGRAIIDSRPFQIFEGSNDILYQQIAESVVKKVKKAGSANLYDFLSGYDLTSRASELIKKLTAFSLDYSLSQRKLVELGKVLGLIVSMDMVLSLGDRGFHKQLISNALETLQQEIHKGLLMVTSQSEILPVEQINDNLDWYSMVNA